MGLIGCGIGAFLGSLTRFPFGVTDTSSVSPAWAVTGLSVLLYEMEEPLRTAVSA